jgi:hypothetical protein
MKNSLRQLYVEDDRPWPVGFSGLPLCHSELVEESLSSTLPSEQSFWVNIIGRGYPPPNRTFRWCTQRSN